MFDSRELTKRGLERELNKALENYMIIYDEYYETMSRDSAFLKDLANAILGISACLEVYARDKYIHPSYVMEKLENSKHYIDACIKYYDNKQKNN